MHPLVVPYKPTDVYSADMLLSPAPCSLLDPPREPLLRARDFLNVAVRPEAERRAVVYVRDPDTGVDSDNIIFLPNIRIRSSC